MFRLALGVAAALAACACAGQVPAYERDTTTTVTQVPLTTTSVTTSTEPPVVPEELADFAVRLLAIEDGDVTYSLLVAVADSPQKRSQGLMGLVDLGDLDGMIFVWPDLTTSPFWMKDTLIPLDIAFFAPDGSWVSNFTMVPCADGECPNYSADGPYLYAIEVPDSGFAGLTPAARLDLDV